MSACVYFVIPKFQIVFQTTSDTSNNTKPHNKHLNVTKLSVSNQNDWSEALRHLIVHTALTQYYTCMSYSGWVNQKKDWSI